MKRIALLLVVCILLFSSCDFINKDMYIQQVKTEFSPCFSGTNEVAFVMESNVYFNGATININNLIQKNEEYIPFWESPDEWFSGGVVFDNEGFFFCSSQSVHTYSGFSKQTEYIWRVYRTDYSGENISIFFEKSGYSSVPRGVANGKDIFVYHYEEKTAFKEEGYILDRYNTLSGEYINLGRGSDISINDYLVEENNQYEVKLESFGSSTKDRRFIVTNKITQKNITIDDNYLKKTIYYDAMVNSNYYLDCGLVIDDHILLIYYLKIYNTIIINKPLLVLELDFETGELEYKMLSIFPDYTDMESGGLVYFG